MATVLSLKSIRRDGGTQVRAELNADHVADIADAIRAGGKIDPVVVYYDGSVYWLADGFHRVAGSEAADRGQIAADVRTGTQRDAVLYACGANASHGLKRTDTDKRRAVETLLRDPEWSQWSDREIARRCFVSAPFVGKVRAEIPPSVNGLQIDAVRKVERNGKVYEQDTSRVGKRDPKPSKPAALAFDPRDDEERAALARHEALADDIEIDTTSEPIETVVADGTTAPEHVDWSDADARKPDLGELADGMAFTKIDGACRAFEQALTSALEKHPLLSLRGTYRSGAENSLLRVMKLVSEQLKTTTDRPAFGVIRGGK
jgi:hypothetical protein